MLEGEYIEVGMSKALATGSLSSIEQQPPWLHIANAFDILTNSTANLFMTVLTRESSDSGAGANRFVSEFPILDVEDSGGQRHRGR